MTAPPPTQMGLRMPKGYPGNSGAERGFVLAATLWMLAILAVTAGYFAERVQRARELAQLAQAHAQAFRDLYSARAEILFRIGTTPFSLYGLGSPANEAIVLDDRPYSAAGDTLVRLQDNRGLLNLNAVDDVRLGRFLSILDVPPARQAALIDALRDYVDEDNLKRLNGAEATDYAAAGLPPPRNARLVTPMEARNIYGWGEVRQLWQDNLLPKLTATSSSLFLNPNTAPWQVLATMGNMTPEAARAIIAARKLAPITDAKQIEALAGIEVRNDPFMPDMMVFPADSVRITQQAGTMVWGWQYNVTLTPASDTAPWRIDYSYRVELPSFDPARQAVQSLPTRVASHPERPVSFY